MAEWLKKSALLGYCSLAMATGAEAHAQNTAPEGIETSTTEPYTEDAAGMGNEIVVTARGREQRLQDVPVSATVASGENLVERNITDLQGLSRALPNINVSPAPLSDFVIIRGVGSSVNLGFEQSVATFVDGIYRGRARSTRAALFDIDRVEVLRGPQTTFFGNNAIAGAINVTTRKPGQRLEANGTGFYAPSLGEYNLEAGISVPLSENFAVRLAGQQSGITDGYIYNSYLDKRGPHLNDRIGRLSLFWTPTQNLTVNARLDIGRRRDKHNFFAELVDCPPSVAGVPALGTCARYLNANGGVVEDELNRRSASEDSFLNYDHLEAEQTATLRAGDNELMLRTGYFEHDYRLVNELTGVPGTQGGSVIGTRYGVAANINEDLDQFSQEIRFSSPADNKFSYMVGGYYSRTELELEVYHGIWFLPMWAFAPPGTYPPNTPIAHRFFTKEKSEQLSAFASLSLQLSDRLTIDGGIRYSRVKKRASRRVELGASGDLPTRENFVPGPSEAQAAIAAVVGDRFTDFAPNRRTDDKLMPSVTVKYEFSRDTMAYASFTNGFKAGGFAMWFSENGQFDPETVDAFEIGLKAQAFDDAVAMNLAAFYSKYKNLQETVTFLNPAGGIVQRADNAAKSVSKGIEAGLTVRPVPGLTFKADVAYLIAKYTQYPNAPCTPVQAFQAGGGACTQDLSGVRRSFSPRYSGTVSLAYNYPITEKLEINVDGNVYFTSWYFNQPNGDPTTRSDGYAKLDARIALGARGGHWQLAIVGRNLTNKLTASFRNLAATAPGSTHVLADAPRSVGLQARFSF